MTAADAFVLLLIEQWGVRQLEAVFGAFIAVMAGSFGVMYSNADIPQSEVLQGELMSAHTGHGVKHCVTSWLHSSQQKQFS